MAKTVVMTGTWTGIGPALGLQPEPARWAKAGKAIRAAQR